MFKYGHDSTSDADLAFACHFELELLSYFLYLYIPFIEYELPTQKHLSKKFVGSPSTDVVYR